MSAQFLSVAQTLLDKSNFQEIQVSVHWHVYNRRPLVRVRACITAVVLCILLIHSSTEAPCPLHCQLHNYNPMSAPSLLGFACRNTQVNTKTVDMFTCRQIKSFVNIPTNSSSRMKNRICKIE